MKLIELFESTLLLEYAGIFNLDDYGAWYNSQTKEVLRVENDFDHLGVLSKIRQKIEGMPQMAIDPWDDTPEPVDDTYHWGFKNHWIRLAFWQSNNGFEIDIQGDPKDIRKSYGVLAPLATEADILVIAGVEYNDNQKYYLPQDAPKIRKWFLSESLTESVGEKKFWYNTDTGEELVVSGGMHHFTWAIDNISAFGKEGAGILEKYQDIFRVTSYETSAVIELAETGWVRVYYAPNKNMEIECISLDQLYATLLNFTMDVYVDKVFFDILSDREISGKLEHDQIDYFLRRKKLPPDCLTEETLKEYVDKINPTQYGYWYDLNKDAFYPVPSGGHAHIAREIHAARSDEPVDNIYTWAYNQNWVRIVNTNPAKNEIGVAGTMAALKQFWKKYRGYFLDSNFVVIDIETKRATGEYKSKYYRFVLPAERRNLVRFFADAKVSLPESILNEYREYLDTTQYGSWIDTRDMTVYPVLHSHANTMYDILKKEDPAEYEAQQKDESKLDAYDWAELQGFVRVVHENFDNAATIEIEGKFANIKKAWPLLAPTLKNANSVYIDVVDQAVKDGNFKSIKYYRFYIPQQLAQMNSTFA
jgi:hypothetical protein